MIAAQFSETVRPGVLRCNLCPHHCTLENGQTGRCRTRKNMDGILMTESYGILSAISLDPVEKKPLYHFLPGRPILSIGSFGCNLRCAFCQNCHISQAGIERFDHHPVRDPEDIVQKAKLSRNNIGLAYTYNEPTVYFEYMHQAARLIHEQGQRNVMVTNGFIEEEPLRILLPLIDAFNIDLKSFRNEFYQTHAGSTLQPVLRSIEQVAKSGKHLEITCLLIPGLNDSPTEWRALLSWLSDHAGGELVLHVSRYHPASNMSLPPTPRSVIEEFTALAREHFPFTYPGNVGGLNQDTHCPQCGMVLIRRSGYHTEIVGLDGNACGACRQSIPGIFR
ncbi:MAG: AmmeMemoRadiSam system radical SAM enzyme [Bacteroidales bacterium]